LNKWVI